MSTKICSVQACVKKEITQCNTTRRDIFTGFGQVKSSRLCLCTENYSCDLVIKPATFFCYTEPQVLHHCEVSGDDVKSQVMTHTNLILEFIIWPFFLTHPRGQI